MRRRTNPQVQRVAGGTYERADAALEIGPGFSCQMIEDERQRLLNRLSSELSQSRRIRIQRKIRSAVPTEENTEVVAHRHVHGTASGLRARNADGEIDRRP